MKDEIKEILDKLRETADYPKLNYSSYDKSYNETIDNVAMIKSFACKQLLDYITNLQEKLNRIDKLINTDYGWVSYYYKYNNRYLKSEIKEDINNILKGENNEK